MKINNIISLIVIAVLSMQHATAQDNFVATTGPAGGTINTFQFDDQGTIFAVEGESRTCYTSTDGGATWNVMVSNEGKVYTILADGNDLYYSTYESFYKSEDSGDTWQRIGGGYRNVYGLYTFTVGSDKIFVAQGSCEGLYVSTDLGVTWTNITGNTSCGPNPYKPTISPTGDIYYVDQGVGIIRHSFPNDGEWSSTKLETVFNKAYPDSDNELDVAVSSSGTIFISHRNATDGVSVLEKSSSGNAGTFSVISGPSVTSTDRWFSNPLGNMHYADYDNRVLWELTDENAITWVQKTDPAISYSDNNVHIMKWKSASEIYAGNNINGVIKSVDGGISWARSNGSSSNSINAPGTHEIHIFNNGNIVAFDNAYNVFGYWLSTNNGNSYSWQATNFRTYLDNDYGSSLVRLQDNSLLAVTADANDEIRRTTDGVNWTVQSDRYFHHLLTVGSNQIYGLSPEPDSVYLSTDQGVTWDGIEYTDGLPSSFWFMDAGYISNNLFYAIFNNDSGEFEYWRVNLASEPAVVTKLILPINSNDQKGFFALNNKLYASDGNTIAISSNLGVSWTTVNYSHLHMVPINDALNNRTGIGLSDYGTFLITQDDGQTWKTVALDGSFSWVTDLAQDASGNFYAALNGGEIARYEGDLLLASGDLPIPLSLDWEELNGPYGGEVFHMEVTSNNILYAAGDEALFKWNSGGAEWERLSIPDHYWSIHDFDTDGNVLYILNNDHILVSSDAGATWASNYIESGGANDFEISNGNWLIAANNNILLSTDNGTSFNIPGTVSSGNFHHIQKSSTGTIYVARENDGNWTLMTSSDDGVTWQENGLDLTGQEIWSINALESGAVAVVTNSDIYRSTNNGVSWSSILGSAELSTEHVWANEAARIYSAPNGDYYFHNKVSLYRSTDQGTSWQQTVSSMNMIRDMVWYNSNMLVGVLWGETILESTDNGENFDNYPITGLTSSSWYSEDLFVNAGSNILAVVASDVVLRSVDDGDSFERFDTGIWEHGFVKHPDGTIIAFGCGIAESNDNGITWYEVTSNNDQIGCLNNLIFKDGIYYAQANDPSQSNDVIWSSSDLSNWSVVPMDGRPANFGIRAEYIVVDDAGGIYNYIEDYNEGTSNLYRTTNGVSTKYSEFNSFHDIEYYDGKVYIVVDEGIYTTTDGTEWDKLSAPSGTRFSIAENGYFFISSQYNGELWISTDQGVNWQRTEGFKGDDIGSIKVNLSDGYAYVQSQNNPLMRSSNIIIADDGTNPELISQTPAHQADNLALYFSISMTFNEPVRGVTGKNIRLYDVSNPNSSIATFDVTSEVEYSEGNTTVAVIPGTLDYLTTYAVWVDAGAFEDIHGNAYTGFPNITTWTFTTLEEPDLTDPSISFTTAEPDLVKGSQRTFDIALTDNKSANESIVAIYYRGIASTDGTSFQNSELTLQSGGSANSANYQAVAAESWYDAMGLEFYFEAEDKAGNAVRLPISEDEYYYSYIDYGSANPKLSGLKFGETAASFQIVSIPYKLGDSQITTIFDELGEANREKWRMATYTGGATEPYDEFPEDLSAVNRGVGYWFIMRNLTDIEIENASSPENNRTDFFTMSLKQGWNQIGNPYPVAISWEETRLDDQNTLSQVKTYNNGSYSNGDVLSAYQGGFVYAQSAIDVKVRFQGITSGGRKEAITPNLAENNWELPIAIYQNGLGSEIGGIGMRLDASEEIDMYDDYNPPSPLDRVELKFISADRVPVAKNMVTKQENYTYQFDAISEGDGMTELQWDNTQFGDNNIDLILMDVLDQFRVDMRLTNSYKFSSNGSKSFKIYYGEGLFDTMSADLTLLGNPYPNPTSGAVNIPFTITKDLGQSNVLIQIVDVSGQQIGELIQKSYNPGFHQIHWNHDGDLPNGVYFCKWQVKTESGEILNQVKKIIVQ